MKKNNLKSSAATNKQLDLMGGLTWLCLLYDEIKIF